MSDNQPNNGQNFEAFINTELSEALERFDQQDAAVYVYCLVSQPEAPSRRVLVVTEANSAQVVVCIEAAYQLFEGDIHHYVRQVGMLDRHEAAGKLAALVREAYELITAWRPSYEDLAECVFRSN